MFLQEDFCYRFKTLYNFMSTRLITFLRIVSVAGQVIKAGYLISSSNGHIDYLFTYVSIAEESLK